MSFYGRGFVLHGHGTLCTPSSSGKSPSTGVVESAITGISCLLRCALAHGAEESLAYTLIHSGSEDQQVCTLEQLVDNPCGVGIE